MSESFKKNRLLKDIDFNNYNVITCDIFDTLVYRTVLTPSDVFLKVGKQARESKLLVDRIDEQQFKRLRELAEKIAREKSFQKYKNKEITLQDIYNNLPEYIGDVNKIMKLEIDVEKEVIYLNKSIYSFLKAAKRNKLKIILLSDMYLTKPELEEILIYNGADLTLFDNIIVSSEIKKSKADTKLYEYIIENQNIKPSNTLHIGDNYISDIINAKKFGLNTIHYKLNGDFDEKYDRELVKKEKCIGELWALRKEVALNNPYDSNVDSYFWFDYGATILGPIFSVFTEYIYGEAIKNNVNNIHPILRDGHIFGDLLKIKDKNLKFNINPIYASRKSTYLSSKTEFTSNDLREVMKSDQLLVSALMNRIGIKDHPFVKWGNISMARTLSINIDNTTLFDKIEDFLIRIKKQELKDVFKKENLLFTNYFKQEVDVKKEYFTIDIGYSGTISKNIQKALKIKGDLYKGRDFLLLGQKHTSKNILEGSNIDVFIPYENNESFFTNYNFKPFLLESFTSNNSPSVIGYKEKNKEVNPIFKDNYIEKQNEVAKEICLEGVICFYNHFLELIEHKNITSMLVNETDRSSYLWILERLMNYPINKEAVLLGELLTENDFDRNVKKSLCSLEDDLELQQKGLKRYQKESLRREETWIAGIIERRYPYYLAMELYKETSDPNINFVIETIKDCLDKNVQQCIVYGCGDIGLLMVKLLKASNIQPLYIVDRNSLLWGRNVEDIPVVDFSKVKNIKNIPFIIASNAFFKDIETFIREKHINGSKVWIVNKRD
ncbi:HAD family hydrolase [Lysinibacillus sp. NPDC093688]|uniref:HAD family hydrolase n=1 Tax=Lysinibacillus sp. NPDC093688 TaxID=3390577 RepID=UPI003D05E613